MDFAGAKYFVPSNLGERIKKARLEALLTQGEMAKLLSIHRTTLTDYEFNRVFIPNHIITQVEEICKLLKYSLFDEYHLFIENCSQIILDYCDENNITLYDFSKRIGVDRQLVYSWVSKNRKPCYKSWLSVKKLIKC